MKKLILLALLFIVSCKDNMSTLPEKKFNDGDGIFNFNVLKSNESLLEKKFKEFYDLNLLLKKYPDFKEGIEKRIKNFTSNPRSIFNLNDSLQIKNIRQRGELLKISDSIQVTKIYFDLISENSTKTDSVFAFIRKKKVVIDSEEVISTKVNFTRGVIQDF